MVQHPNTNRLQFSTPGKFNHNRPSNPGVNTPFQTTARTNAPTNPRQNLQTNQQRNTMSQLTSRQKNTMSQTNVQIIAPPKDTGKPYRRTPAPESLKWVPGKEDFEDFHDRFTAFIGQQNQMQYILEEKFQSIYLQFGNNKYMTLGLANAAIM